MIVKTPTHAYLFRLSLPFAKSSSILESLNYEARRKGFRLQIKMDMVYIVCVTLLDRSYKS